MPMPMRDCPIFEVEVTEERSQLIYVAAETKEEAEEAARRMSRADIDWFSAYVDMDSYAREANTAPCDIRTTASGSPACVTAGGTGSMTSTRSRSCRRRSTRTSWC